MAKDYAKELKEWNLPKTEDNVKKTTWRNMVNLNLVEKDYGHPK